MIKNGLKTPNWGAEVTAYLNPTFQEFLYWTMSHHSSIYQPQALLTCLPVRPVLLQPSNVWQTASRNQMQSSPFSHFPIQTIHTCKRWYLFSFNIIARNMEPRSHLEGAFSPWPPWRELKQSAIERSVGIHHSTQQSGSFISQWQLHSSTIQNPGTLKPCKISNRRPLHPTPSCADLSNKNRIL